MKYCCHHCLTVFDAPIGVPAVCPDPSPHPQNYTVTPCIGVDLNPVTAHHPTEAVQSVDPAEALLDEAKKTVTGARRQSYGLPENNFGCIADLWTTYVQRRFRRDNPNALDPVVFRPADVAVMMILMKCARLAESPDHHDSSVDIAGYAACLARCQKP